MTGRDEDEAWRAIVENYGERPELEEPEPHAGPGPDARQSSPEPPPAPPEPVAPAPEPEERFVPPAPPPLPRPSGLRGAAWVAVLGVPPLLLVLLFAGVTLPRMLSGLLGVAAVAGFGYLVATMPRGPRDPWDDGSRV